MMSDGSGGLKVPIGKGGHLIICHGSSAATRFIPQTKLVFSQKRRLLSLVYITYFITAK
jgi:hypothetical protein